MRSGEGEEFVGALAIFGEGIGDAGAIGNFGSAVGEETLIGVFAREGGEVVLIGKVEGGHASALGDVAIAIFGEDDEKLGAIRRLERNTAGADGELALLASAIGANLGAYFRAQR